MEEIGQRLRDARIEKGYTLDDLQQITKIQKRYLVAIEEGNFDQLPGNFYVRAFIRQYAETVGVDGNQLLNEYAQTVPDPQTTESVAEAPDHKRALATEPSGINLWFKRNAGKLIISAVVVFVVVCVIAYTLSWAQQRKRSVTTPDDTSSVVVSSKKSSKVKTASTTTSKSSKKSSKSSSQKSSSKKSSDAAQVTAVSGSLTNFTVANLGTKTHELVVSAQNGSAWVQVTLVGGGSGYSGLLAANEKQTLEIPSTVTQIQVQTGNAPNTEIKFDKKSVDLQTSQLTSVVQTFTFTLNRD